MKQQLTLGKKESLLHNTYRHRGLLIMAIPALVILFMFKYIPMFGLVVAFKDFDYASGILGSKWSGFENFKFMLASKDILFRIIRNTLGYWAMFTVVGTLCNITLAIALNECRNKFFSKTAHTIMIMPTFLSWVAASFILAALLNSNSGLVNNTLVSLNLSPVNWYAEPKWWPLILLFVNLWKTTGYGAIIYLSALTGMDPEMFEAAEIDGASKWQQITKLTLPLLIPMVSVMTILALGGIMTSNTGLFYQVTKNIGTLYPATQTIDAYVINALTNGSSNYGMTSAVTVLQSTIGCFLVIITNLIVRKWDEGNALF